MLTGNRICNVEVINLDAPLHHLREMASTGSAIPPGLRSGYDGILFAKQLCFRKVMAFGFP